MTTKMHFCQQKYWKSWAEGSPIGGFSLLSFGSGRTSNTGLFIVKFNKVFSIISGCGQTEVYFPAFANTRSLPAMLDDQTITTEMNKEIGAYNDKQTLDVKEICDQLGAIIDNELTEAENKIWHSHPVWFLNGNPIVGYSKQKAGIRLMFWSGADFEEEKLIVRGDKFKDASVFFNKISDIKKNDLKRWLKKSREIQWDYKNLVKRKGQLEKINLPNT